MKGPGDDQADLFETPLQFGHRRAEDAANHAGPVFKDLAREAFQSYARTHRTFTTEDVRLASDVPEPPTRRAWGAIATWAKKQPIVRHGGWMSAKSRNVHGNQVSIWISLIYAE